MMLLLPSAIGAILDEVGAVAYPAGVGFDFLDHTDIFKFGKITRSLRLCEMTLLRSDIRLVSNLHSSQHDSNLPQYIGINLKGHTNQTPADSRYVVAQNKTQKEEGHLLVKF